MRRCEEKVKERRRGTAESLTLFSNDWLDLMVCVDLFTHLTYMLYWINSIAVISLIIKSKPAGIYAQSLTKNQDLVKHNSIVQRIVNNYFSKTFWVYLFFQNFPGLEIAVLLWWMNDWFWLILIVYQRFYSLSGGKIILKWFQQYHSIRVVVVWTLLFF